MPVNEIDKEELILLLKEVIAEAVEQHSLSDDEVKWVRLAIEAEAKKAAFRKAVIEKTFIGLVSSGALALIYYTIDFVKIHWK